MLARHLLEKSQGLAFHGRGAHRFQDPGLFRLDRLLTSPSLLLLCPLAIELLLATVAHAFGDPSNAQHLRVLRRQLQLAAQNHAGPGLGICDQGPPGDRSPLLTAPTLRPIGLNFVDEVDALVFPQRHAAMRNQVAAMTTVHDVAEVVVREVDRPFFHVQEHGPALLQAEEDLRLVDGACHIEGQLTHLVLDLLQLVVDVVTLRVGDVQHFLVGAPRLTVHREPRRAQRDFLDREGQRVEFGKQGLPVEHRVPGLRVQPRGDRRLLDLESLDALLREGANHGRPLSGTCLRLLRFQKRAPKLRVEGAALVSVQVENEIIRHAAALLYISVLPPLLRRGVVANSIAQSAISVRAVGNLAFRYRLL